MLSAPLETIGTPTIWAVTIAGLVVLLALDYLITRKPHDVSLAEAAGWSAFYVAIPLTFGLWVWQTSSVDTAIAYYTGYIVEKTLSVDNLFVFMMVLGAFAVPRRLQQRVLLFGIVGALILRSIFIALGAAMLSRFDWIFLVFGAVLVVMAVKTLMMALKGDEQEPSVDDMLVTRMLRRVMPTTPEYHGAKSFIRVGGRRTATPLFLAIVAVLSVDVVFAVDSVPAIYGITEDPYLVFVTNAYALLGLRALYFLVEAMLSSLEYLNYGLALILAFIGVKLALHWAHLTWPSIPEIPTVVSLLTIVGILTVTIVLSLVHKRRSQRTDKELVSG